MYPAGGSLAQPLKLALVGASLIDLVKVDPVGSYGGRKR